MTKVLNMKSHFLFSLICVGCVAGLYVPSSMADSNTELSIVNAILSMQSNAAVTADSPGSIPGSTLINLCSGSGSLVALIGGHAFSGLNGILQLNQASGVANLEANSVAIGVGGAEALAKVQLNQQFAPQGPGAETLGSQSGLKKVSISSQAFNNANGILQVSQAAGIGNRLANKFSLQIQGGSP